MFAGADGADRPLIMVRVGQRDEYTVDVRVVKNLCYAVRSVMSYQ